MTNVSSKKRKIVVVGLGSIGRRHARLLRERIDLSVEVCEPSQDAVERAAADIGDAVVHSCLESALKARPDMVVIATPHVAHAEQSIAALVAGADVLCEKPLCVSPDEATRMTTAARRNHRKLVVGFQMHFNPGMLRIRELINSGTLGTILHFHCRVGTFITLANSLSRYQENMEGALLLDYAHQPDLLMWLLGELPRGVTMTGVQGGNLPLTSNPNILSLTLDYERPLLATVHLNYVQMPQRHEYEVVGDKGWVLFDHDAGTLRIGMRETQTITTEQHSTERDDMYRAEHQAFIDTVDGKRPPESPASFAARSVVLLRMALRSWRAGRRVSCDWAPYKF